MRSTTNPTALASWTLTGERILVELQKRAESVGLGVLERSLKTVLLERFFLL